MSSLQNLINNLSGISSTAKSLKQETQASADNIEKNSQYLSALLEGSRSGAEAVSILCNANGLLKHCAHSLNDLEHTANECIADFCK